MYMKITFFFSAKTDKLLRLKIFNKRRRNILVEHQYSIRHINTYLKIRK